MRVDLTTLEGAAVLFDLDGTLVDSAPDLARVLNVLLEREGVPPLSPETVRPMVGKGARKLLERGLEESGLRPGTRGSTVWSRIFLRSTAPASPN